MSRFSPRVEGWEALTHPRAEHPVVGTDGSRPRAGSGLLRLRLGKRGEGGPRAHDMPDKWVYPGTPVVLVDGTPTVQGFGSVAVELPVGEHDVEIQAGGTRGWWPVRIDPHEPVDLDFVNDLSENRASGKRWYLGPPKRRGRRSGGADQPWRELAADPPLEAGASLAPMAPSRPDLPESFGMLAVDLRWEPVWQRLAHPEGTGLPQMRQYGEPQPSRNRPWLENPTLLIGDHVLDARWGRLCVPLRPGAVEIDLAVPARSDNQDGEFFTLQESVEIETGRISRRTVTAEVVQHHDGEDYRLEVVALGSEAHRPSRKLPAFQAPRPELRRMDGEERSHRPYSIELEA